MENYLMLNGKRIDLTEEQVKTLTAEEKKNSFERKENGIYYSIGLNGLIGTGCEEFDNIDNQIFDIANYCTDKALMKQRALHETLNRLLWRYSEERGGDNEPWDNIKTHFYIMISSNYIGVAGADYYKTQGAVYFNDKETAQSAIEEIVKPFMAQHPEFVW